MLVCGRYSHHHFVIRMCTITCAQFYVLNYMCFITCAPLHVLNYMCFIACAHIHVLHRMCSITCASLHVLNYMCLIKCVFGMFYSHRWYIRNQDEAHAVAGLIPLLNASKQMKKRTSFRDYNSFIFHTFWKKFLKPIKVCF